MWLNRCVARMISSRPVPHEHALDLQQPADDSIRMRDGQRARRGRGPRPRASLASSRSASSRSLVDSGQELLDLVPVGGRGLLLQVLGHVGRKPSRRPCVPSPRRPRAEIRDLARGHVADQRDSSSSKSGWACSSSFTNFCATSASPSDAHAAAPQRTLGARSGEREQRDRRARQARVGVPRAARKSATRPPSALVHSHGIQCTPTVQRLRLI